MENRHIQEEAKYNPSTSHQLCNMTALDFGPECTYLRHIDLSVINKQNHTYPRFTETLACYPQSRDETLAKYPYAKKYVDMNSPAIRSLIRVFSFRPEYFFSETKEEIKTYMDDK